MRFLNTLELRVLVLLSLAMQIILILFGSSRRRNVAYWPIRIPLWWSYLLADIAATLALGVISNHQGDSDGDANCSKDQHVDSNNYILIFWSPFLLLHLGGPDTITAFALEDNELWLRRLVELISQVGVAGYVIFRYLRHTNLLSATILMFIAGIIQYGARIWALMSASRDIFRDSMVSDPEPGPNYPKFVEELASKETAGRNVKISRAKEPEFQMRPEGSESDNTVQDIKTGEIISEAHRFFQIFKRLIVDLILTFQDRNDSTSFFKKRNWNQAYKVIEIELGFVYDVLYTKAAVIHTLPGCILRIFSAASIISAFIVFKLVKKHRYSPTDVIISYVLLLGAIALEIWSLTRLAFSYWTLVWLKKHNLLGGLFKFSLDVNSLFRHCKRWSNSMAQYNLVKFCLKDKPSRFKKVMKSLKFKEIFDKYWYRTYIEVTGELKEFIFDDLKKKLKNADDSVGYKHFNTCRGELALEEFECNGNEELQQSIKVEFDESILLWHIATDLCYHSDGEQSKEGRKHSGTVLSNQRKSRAVSNYMLYLLVSHPFMLTAGIGQIRFGDTCAEAKKFFYQPGIYSDAKGVCVKLLGVETKVPPAEVKGDKSKTVLFEACILAKSLLGSEMEKRWELISHIWVEMLYYAASHCTGYYHAQRLSEGGELLTVVWFLMAHLGIGQQYRVEAGHARAKPIVEN